MESMVKQTAVEWLEENIKKGLQVEMSYKFQQMFNQAKEMEARQKIDLTEICKCDSTGQTWVCNCCGRPYIEKKVKV